MRVFAWFLALFLAGFACIAVFTYPAWLLLHPHFDFPFHRIGERIGMLALLAGFALAARRLRLADRRGLGYGAPRPVFLREMLIGLIIGVVTMAGIVGIMNALGLLAWGPAPDGALPLARLILTRLASGLAVAVIEETFLRGAMYTGIARESGAVAAVVLTSLVYAATHFFAAFKIPADRVSAWSGVDLVAGTLQVLVHPLAIGDAFACLFAVGVMLGAVRVATGNIAAGIGLHAGWVWVMLAVHDLARPLRAAPWSFLISRFDGFIGWLVFACTLPLGLGLWRFYGRRYASGTSGASTSSR